MTDMSQSLQPIITRYLEALEQEDEVSERSAVIRRELTTLMFADAVERKLTLAKSHPDHPRQVVVVGPTQAGKSTLVNVLLGIENTQSSARAGFTVHCHGYACSAGDDDWLQVFFTNMNRQSIGSLQRSVLDEYSYTDVTSALNPAIADRYQQVVFWDTPDFDSVASFHYRSPVLQTIALADLVVMIVSKEKYADKSVWDTLQMLTSAGKQVMLVMNKTPPQVRDELAVSVNSKYRHIDGNAFSSQLPLVFIDEVSNPHQALADSQEISGLREQISDNLERPDPQLMRTGLESLVSGHWQNWVQPISRRHGLQQHWKKMVRDTSDSLLGRYETEFLQNSSRHKETFQLAVAELLVLLEVPGMAEPLTRLRNLVTWPVRKVISTAVQHSEANAGKRDKRTEERRLLEELLDHGLTSLAVQVSQQPDNDVWWSELGAKLSGSTAAISKGYHNELDNYQTLLKVETERAARALYTQLQDQPATLNSLRAARVSADAAAVVLAVKSGGLGAADLVIAPAMLSLTTMLTESALGQYMKKVQQDLQNYQKKAVGSLINRKLTIKLNALTHDPGITPEQLQQTARHFNVIDSKIVND